MFRRVQKPEGLNRFGSSDGPEVGSVKQNLSGRRLANGGSARSKPASLSFLPGKCLFRDGLLLIWTEASSRFERDFSACPA